MTHKKYYQNKPEYKGRRQRLRWFQTKAEEVLWKGLRGRALGYRFRRQFQIGWYIVDFYCHQKKLVIELDGPIHQYQQEYDAYRTKRLQEKGCTVVRFTNDEVLFDRERVIEEIISLLVRGT